MIGMGTEEEKQIENVAGANRYNRKAGFENVLLCTMMVASFIATTIAMVHFSGNLKHLAVFGFLSAMASVILSFLIVNSIGRRADAYIRESLLYYDGFVVNGASIAGGYGVAQMQTLNVEIYKLKYMVIAMPEDIAEELKSAFKHPSCKNMYISKEKFERCRVLQ